jgi:hypothetical protein
MGKSIIRGKKIKRAITKSSFTLVKLAVVIFLVTLQVSATPISDTVTMSHVGYGAKGTMTIWGGGENGLNVYAGVYIFNKTAGTGEGQLLNNGFIGGFCMDLAESVVGGSLNYDVLLPQDGPRPTTFLDGPMGQGKAAYLAELWSEYFDPAWAAGGSYTYQQKKGAEAFAVAVWEIVYEDLPSSSAGWDVTIDGTSGSKGFRAQNLDYQTANTWLHALDGRVPMVELRTLSYNGSQDFLVALPQMPIPEPSTLAIFAVTGLLFGRRRSWR